MIVVNVPATLLYISLVVYAVHFGMLWASAIMQRFDDLLSSMRIGGR